MMEVTRCRAPEDAQKQPITFSPKTQRKWRFPRYSTVLYEGVIIVFDVHSDRNFGYQLMFDQKVKNQYFYFPSNPQLKQWMLACGKDEATFKADHGRMCQQHFQEHCFEQNSCPIKSSKKNILIPGSVPTENLILKRKSIENPTFAFISQQNTPNGQHEAEIKLYLFSNKMHEDKFYN